MCRAISVRLRTHLPTNNLQMPLYTRPVLAFRSRAYSRIASLSCILAPRWESCPSTTSLENIVDVMNAVHSPSACGPVVGRSTLRLRIPCHTSCTPANPSTRALNCSISNQRSMLSRPSSWSTSSFPGTSSLPTLACLCNCVQELISSKSFSKDTPACKDILKANVVAWSLLPRADTARTGEDSCASGNVFCTAATAWLLLCRRQVRFRGWEAACKIPTRLCPAVAFRRLRRKRKVDGRPSH